MHTKRKLDLYEEQEILETAEDIDQDDYLPFPLYRHDDWLNEAEGDWPEDSDTESQG